jgi:hypothetical protein
MNFLTKKSNEVVLNFPQDLAYPGNYTNPLKNGWPIYELWINNNFIGFWEFIPNGYIGVNGTRHHKFWSIIYDTILIFNEKNQPITFLQKENDDLVGFDLNNNNVKYNLKYIET